MNPPDSSVPSGRSIPAPPADLGDASDSFDQYVADLDLLNSDQAREPERTFRYADRDHGQLLKSVLDPARAKAMLAIYFRRSVQGKHPPNVATSLGTVLRRYGMAFQKQPKKYESEYLDSFDDEKAAAEMSIPAISALISALSTQKAQDAMRKLKQHGLDFSGAKAMLVASYRLLGVVSAAEAKTLRKQIADHMFSEIGAKRAQRIADKLTGIAALYAPAPATTQAG